ncbi:MAG: hypothetical protein JWN32_2497, partial [Solirubrobacterales bacterium]|nr:hypothetical protein [Solirubrobacterales bacterium]
MRVRLPAAAAAILVVGCGLSAGGGTQATKTDTGTSAAAPKPMAATRTTPTAATNKPRDIARSAVMTACDANILAKRGTTSGLFAQNVFYEFWQAELNGDDAVRAYSPVSQRTYDLACVADATIVCRGSDGSEVRFSRAALDGYDRAQADAFRC